MTTRRNFLTGCRLARRGLCSAAAACRSPRNAQGSAGPRLPRDGQGAKRIKTIDVHAHCFFFKLRST